MCSPAVRHQSNLELQPASQWVRSRQLQWPGSHLKQPPSQMQDVSCQASKRGHRLQEPGSLTAKLQYSGSSVTVVSSGSVMVLGSTSGQLRASLPRTLSRCFLQRHGHPNQR